MGLFDRIAVIGFGNMGQALIDGAIAKNCLSQSSIHICAPSLVRKERHSHYNVALCNTDAVQNANMILLATKPFQIEEVCREIACVLAPDALVVSIAAGITTVKIQQYLDAPHQAIIRAMPNTPVSVGYGATGFYANEWASLEQIERIQSLFEATGAVIRVHNEFDIDKITAVSGSGPAYFLLFQQYMAESAQQLGLQPIDAENLVKQTMLGTAMWLQESTQSFAEKRLEVTSMKGTTAAAIDQFIANNLKSIVFKAMEAAYKRAIELSAI